MRGLAQPPRRKFAFMLTPLVDVMFLLLIFFMLSSQTAPYSLLEIVGGGDNAPAEPQAQPAPAPAPTAPTVGDVVVSISRGYVRFNGERVEMADLAAAIERYKAAGYSSAMVLTTQAATVQDVVSVLEVFEGSAFGDMKLVLQQGGAAP